MPHSPKSKTNEVQTEEAVDPAAICSLLTSDLIATLRTQAEEIRLKDIPGWGNTMEFAADTLEKYVKAMDAIYNHNVAARAAVIQHFGLWHYTANVSDRATASKKLP